MKIQTFLEKASKPVSPAKFLVAHKDFLLSFPSTAKVFEALIAGQLFPTPALMKILFLIQKEKDPVKVRAVKVPKVAKEKQDKEPTTQRSPLPPKKHQVFLYFKDGRAERYSAELFQDALRIVKNRLSARQDATHADIVGLGVCTKVSRDDAMRAKYGRQPGQGCALRKNPKASGNGKASQTRVMFSWG